ncbi:MAG: transposase [Pirellulaceae bacterium]
MRTKQRNTARTRRHVPGQKPLGCFQERVQKVGPEQFAIIAVDCGKPQARLRVANFYGQILLEPFSADISRPGLQMACERIQDTFERHHIQDCVAAIETTGRYHRPIKLAFQQQHWEARDVHPFTSNLFRRAADESIKTDDIDLAAIHRAATDGLAMCPEVIDVRGQQWRVLTRHRRDLVEKGATLKVQLKEVIHAYLPGYCGLWGDEEFWQSMSPASIAIALDSPAAMQQASDDQFRQAVQHAGGKVTIVTIRRIRSWSYQAAPPDEAAAMYHRRAAALWRDLQTKQQEIAEIEVDLADFLCSTPGVLLLAFPGIHVVTASDYAAELGPLTNYATSKSIAGRAGLYPSRYQTSTTDLTGPLSIRRNRQLRAALMRMARNLSRVNAYFMSQARTFHDRQPDDRQKGKAKVIVARSFSRLSYYLLASGRLFAHAALQDGEKILQKLLEFYQQRGADPMRVTRALDAAVAQLQPETLQAEHRVFAERHQRNTQKRRGGGVRRLSEILPAVLLRIDQRIQEAQVQQTSQTQPTHSLQEDATHGS